MTVSQAIKQTRKEVTQHTEWNSNLNMWEEVIKPAGTASVSWNKARKVAYAANLLGYDRNDAYEFALQPGSWTDLLYAFLLRQFY